MQQYPFIVVYTRAVHGFNIFERRRQIVQDHFSIVRGFKYKSHFSVRDPFYFFEMRTFSHFVHVLSTRALAIDIDSFVLTNQSSI
jgi:hypothetical protein